MLDRDKTKQQLIDDIKKARKRLAALEFTAKNHAGGGQPDGQSDKIERDYRYFFEANPYPMWVYDKETLAFLAVNDAAIAHYGYQREEFLSMTIKDIRPEKDVPRLLDLVAKPLEGFRETGSWRHRKKDGTIIDIEITSHSLVFAGRKARLVLALDVTSRKQAEDALRESEHRFKTLAEASFEGIALSESGVVLDVNDQLTNMLGYERSEIIGKPVLEFIAPEHKEFVQDAILTERAEPYEHLMVRKNGAAFPVEIRARLAYIDGREIHLTAIRDITERKHSEERLRRSEELLQRSQHIAHVGSWELDIVSNTLLWSNEIYRIFEIDPGKFGASYEAFLKLVHPEDRETVNRAYKDSVKNREPYDIVHRLLLHDGRIKFVHERCETFYDPVGNPVRSIGAVQDITKRRQAEQHTTDALNFVSTMMESSPIGIVSIKTTGAVVAANKASSEITGGAVDQLLKQNVRDLEAWKKYGLLSAFDEALSTSSEKRIETNYISTFGKHMWLSVRFIPYIFEDESHVLAVLTDMSDRKREEEEREKLQVQLLQSQKMESVGRLAGGVAHDFNNMLLAILGYTEMAMMECAPTEKLHAYLKMIEQSALRSADLVRQLLAFARKQTVAPRVLNLNDTVTGLIKMLKRLIGENIDFAWMPGADLWPIKIDPSQIDQLLANLCVNARDAISGVGKITIETGKHIFDKAYCTIHTGFVPGEYVMLAVSDNGCGMSKEVIDHLFEPFFTTKEAGKGTGLGLATVYGTVKQNEGFINVYSEPGKGSTFRIYLPKSKGEAIELTGATSTREMPKGRGETVLLVEDEAVILDLGKEMLETLGYSVLTAGTPGEALRQVKAHVGKIQLLITDVVMPEMNGRNLAKLLREMIPGLKCLFSSGYTANVIAHQGILDEGVHFLQKPFSRRDLATKVREALEQE